MGLSVTSYLHTKKNAIRANMDLPPQVENVSGHHALVSHVDACFGLEREGNDLIAFGGVARNSVTSTQMLEEDLESLRFEVANGEQAAKTVMTMKRQGVLGYCKGNETLHLHGTEREGRDKEQKSTRSNA
jgi:hypothetical protein